MTKTEAQSIVTEYIRDWCGEFSAEYVRDSILNGTDEEAIEALETAGFDFNWEVKVITD